MYRKHMATCLAAGSCKSSSSQRAKCAPIPTASPPQPMQSARWRPGRLTGGPAGQRTGLEISATTGLNHSQKKQHARSHLGSCRGGGTFSACPWLLLRLSAICRAPQHETQSTCSRGWML